MAFLFGKKVENIAETRPWGDFEILNNKYGLVIKKITVKPKKRLSYQSHNNRAEHWFIISGQGKITLNDNNYNVQKAGSFDIPIKAKHRIGNISENEDLVFIEISNGNFDENDIIRYEDDFGRA